MLTIQTTGFDDFLDNSANIRTLIIGGPGVGKTRWSSFWPKPLLLDCEGNRGSLLDRKMPFVRITSSKDMLDALEHLKVLNRTPKAQRQFQTIVVDTADSFQRIVKEEWVTANKAAAFTGFDAWGYLDTKMQLLFTRLINLDYNIVVLVHFDEKTHKDGDNNVREYGLQLQGAIAKQIFNDFGLVGWMGTYWDSGENGRVQKRGLTFKPTPDKHFLKDSFNITPAWMECKLDDESDYQQLMDLFLAKVEDEAIPEREVVGEIPDAQPENAVAPPREGGPIGGLAKGPTSSPASPSGDQPLDKMLKSELEEIAKGLGISVRGNTLKGELITSIEAARAAQASTAPAKTSGSSSTETSSPASTPSPSEQAAPDLGQPAASTPTDDPWSPPETEKTSAPSNSSSSTSSDEQPTSPAESEAGAPPAADSASPSTSSADAEALVAAELGGEVIPEEQADAPVTPPQQQQPSTPVAKPASAPQGPSACAECGADLSAQWADPAGKQALRMTFIKNRRYLCAEHTPA